jgi:alpha-galactosidase
MRDVGKIPSDMSQVKLTKAVIHSTAGVNCRIRVHVPVSTEGAVAMPAAGKKANPYYPAPLPLKMEIKDKSKLPRCRWRRCMNMILKPKFHEMYTLRLRNSIGLMAGLLFATLAQAGPADQFLQALKNSRAAVIGANGQPAPAAVQVSRSWNGNFCDTRITNTGAAPLRLKEVVVAQAGRILPSTTPFYAEGFQMLTQTAGTLGKPKTLGNYTDAGHYKIPEPEGYLAVYNLLRLYPAGDPQLLLGFTSSRRFAGKFYLNADTIKVVMDLENLSLQPGASFQLEEWALMNGEDGNALLDLFAKRIDHHHPKLAFKQPPTGWCSWYCFGPRVTAQNIYDNLDYIKTHIPALRYIQIDDGYQPHMGDWLSVGKSFGGNVQQVLRTIRDKGFEPAIWVAPFICDSNSVIYKTHPDWLVKDASGKPLRSDLVSFGGWRLKPWYVLDGTHPAVQQHLQQLFRTMREQWGVTYFKLDANFWGAIHGGYFYDKQATRVEAYRRGMEAILKGSRDAFILGCNHPLWPSLGLVHGSRSSMDIKRQWPTFERSGRENLYRAWQNGRLWWNDPDCLVLTGKMPDNEFRFHAALIYATGGMLLSGDDLTTISPERLDVLRKTVPPTAQAAAFEDSQFEVGRLSGPKGKYLVLLNWDSTAKKLSAHLDKPCEVVDYFSGKSLGRFSGEYSVQLQGHDGTVLELREEGGAWLEQLKKDRGSDILSRAAWARQQAPITVTAYTCSRSAGGKHDFYSEGDYWWPDPASADSPYIQRDGETNPDNFVEHRRAMVRFSRVMGALAAGYVVSKDEAYLRQALMHARAWFVDTATMMSPNLRYAQAIKGRATGRGIGIIDTIHFLEVVQALRIMEKAGVIPVADLLAIKDWFKKYLGWLTTHPYGQDEMKAVNNHGTCWVMQVAMFAKWVGDRRWMDFCAERYKTVLLPDQMAANGSFPRELRRTKPYGYSLFNLDAMTMVCQILSSNKNNNLWSFTLPDGKDIRKGMAFMAPYVKDKSSWPFAKDVMYWDNWPVAQPFLLFGAVAFNNRDYYRLWQQLDHDPQVEEVLRNLPVRNPIIWLD